MVWFGRKTQPEEAVTEDDECCEAKKGEQEEDHCAAPELEQHRAAALQGEEHCAEEHEEHCAIEKEHCDSPGGSWCGIRGCACRRLTGKVDLHEGAHYWQKHRLHFFVTVLFIGCIFCDMVLMAAMPLTTRQAKRAAQGIKITLELSEDIVVLYSKYLRDYKNILSYDVQLSCSLQAIGEGFLDVTKNCSAGEVQQLKAAMDGAWNTTDDYLSNIMTGELDCNETLGFWNPEKRPMWNYVGMQCRSMCNVREDVQHARSEWNNLTLQDWAEQAVQVTLAIENGAEAAVDFQESMNEIADSSGILSRSGGKYSACSQSDAGGGICDDGEVGEDLFNFADDLEGLASKARSAAECVERYYLEPTRAPTFSQMPTTLVNRLNFTSLPTMFPTTILAPSFAPTTREPTSQPTALDANRTSVKDKSSCEDEDYFSVIRQFLSVSLSVLDVFEILIIVFLGVIQIFSDASIGVVLLIWFCFLFVHLVTLLFLGYVTYFSHESGAQYLGKFCSRLKEAFQSTRVHGKLPDSPKKSVETSPRVRARRFVEASAVTNAGRTADCLCDTDYTVRWWFIYHVYDLMFWFSVGLLIFNLLCAIMGAEKNCNLFYDDYIPSLQNELRDAKRDLAQACFIDLKDHVRDNIRDNILKSKNSECRVAKKSGGLSPAGSLYGSIVVCMVTAALVVLQWHLTHWLPTAIGFAKTNCIRGQLQAELHRRRRRAHDEREACAEREAVVICHQPTEEDLTEFQQRGTSEIDLQEVEAEEQDPAMQPDKMVDEDPAMLPEVAAPLVVADLEEVEEEDPVAMLPEAPAVVAPVDDDLQEVAEEAEDPVGAVLPDVPVVAPAEVAVVVAPAENASPTKSNHWQ